LLLVSKILGLWFILVARLIEVYGGVHVASRESGLG
jgi:hypothetical protein